jgi:hypothetical protein
MNFTEAVTEIIGLTGRPDKTVLIASAINAAISDCTVKANLFKDLVETSIPIDATIYGDTITFNNLVVPIVTRFRKFKYVKPTGVTRYLKPIGVDQIFTPGGNMQQDIYYVAGNDLTYILRDLTTALEIGYYQYAPVLIDGGTHWMLDLMPWTIIDLAAARVFKQIGDDSSFKTHLGMGNDSFKLHRNDYEDGVLEGAQ